MVSNSDQISVFINGFNMMILCYLGQKDSLLNVGGKVLLLRLINNLVVSDIKFAESLYNESIIDTMIRLFRDEGEPIIFNEFISTLTSFTTQTL